MVSPSQRRRAAHMLQQRLGLSQRRACQIVGQHRSTQRHRPENPDPDRDLRRQLRDFSRHHPRWGYRRAHAVLRREGHHLNRKKVQRLWREEGLRMPPRRHKQPRLGISTTPADRLFAAYPNHVWALDYQFDVTSTGRTLKILHVTDEFTRESLSDRLLLLETPATNTPYAAAHLLARAIGGQEVTYLGYGHSWLLNGSSNICMQHIVSDYYIRGMLPTSNARCVA
jgi:HTH-like domain/TAP-like protein